MDLANCIQIARGTQPADLILKNARLVNVLTSEIYTTDVVIAGTRVVAVGKHYDAHHTLDLGGRYLCPGFIDAHVHIESAMVPPHEFARAVLPHGVTSVVTDPHEIANVLGLDGIRFMQQDAKYGALGMYLNAPSCVPATLMETGGAQLDSCDIASLLHDPWVLGLAEVMNYPGVISADKGMIAKLQAYSGKVMDGHCPGLIGKPLNAYVAAGIMSDHECTSIDEALEKLRLGMTIFLREATNAHNLRTLLPLITPSNERRICFCTDDRQPADLLDYGSIDHMIRLAVSHGLDPVSAIRMATINPAEYFRLHDLGAIAPGRRADLVIFSNLHDLQPEQVYRGGKLVAQEGHLIEWKESPRNIKTRGTVNINWSKVDLAIPATGHRIRVIGAIPNQLITHNLIEDASIRHDLAVANPQRNLLKIAVIERHMGTGNIGLGFVKGIGLQRGAIASTIAHDHHNLIVIGADDQSMMTAARAVADTLGGQAVAEGGHVLAHLPLPIAGLMSHLPIQQLRRQMDVLLTATSDLGSSLHDPFMAMSFLALEVIPSLKLTDVGLVDVDQFKLVPLFVT